MQYDFVHQSELEIKPASKKKWLVTFGVGSLIMIASFFVFNLLQQPVRQSVLLTQSEQPQSPTSLETLNQPLDRGSPLETGVAGASDFNTQNNNTSFTVIDDSVCVKESSFLLGDRERTPTDHPADEFNWAGALNELGQYSNPFIVGQDSLADFPWKTGSGETISLQFDQPNTEQSELDLGWVVGSTDSKSITILLDGQPVGTTPTHTGAVVAGWQQMQRADDTVQFMVKAGGHTLTLRPNTSGEAVIWDYLELKGCK